MFLPFWCSKKHATTHLKDQWPCHLSFKLFPVQFNWRDGTCSWVLDATYDTALKNFPLWRTSQLSLWPWGLKRKAGPAILHQISVVPDVPPLPHICMHIPTTTSLTHIYTHAQLSRERQLSCFPVWYQVSKQSCRYISSLTINGRDTYKEPNGACLTWSGAFVSWERLLCAPLCSFLLVFVFLICHQWETAGYGLKAFR